MSAGQFVSSYELLREAGRCPYGCEGKLSSAEMEVHLLSEHADMEV